MRKCAIIFLILSIVFLPGRNRPIGCEIMKESFEKYNIELTSCRTDGFVNLDCDLDSRDEGEQTARQILNALELNNSEYKLTYDEKLNKISASGEFNNGKINLVIGTDVHSSSENNCSYAIVDITQYDRGVNINDTRDRLYDCLSKFGEYPSVKVCITGSVKGSIPENERKLLINKIMDDMGAKKADSVENGGLFSTCGYSECIPGYINYNGMKVNLNAASRYNSFEDKTYFWIGTPIIDVEY